MEQSIFCLKIMQKFVGYKKGPFRRNYSDQGGIPYTLSVKLTVSRNLSVFFSAKGNFLWLKSSKTCASYMDTGSGFRALPCTELAIYSFDGCRQNGLPKKV